MATKRQHFVPRVYMKAWETFVERKEEPSNKFRGVYVFKNNESIGDGANRNSILWKPHLYTIGFNFFFITQSCPLIYGDFVDKVYELMKNNSPMPIYGKLGYSVIKTKGSVKKHLPRIDEWEFYYEDGNLARKKSIKSQIDNLNSYVIEMAFDDCFEKKWESVYNRFIDVVRNGKIVALGKSERIIPMQDAIDMLSFFFMFLCRSPYFDAMGIYSNIKARVLYPVFEQMCKGETDEGVSAEEIEELESEGRMYADDLMKGVWYSELYRMLFKRQGGFYHNIVLKAMEGCQMILYEASDGAGTFITSDNPAFEHISKVEAINRNGFLFPITPKYLLFIAKGMDDINIVAHKYANTDTIRHFNRIIKQHKMDTLISVEKMIDRVL